jgi:hypothetical protein
MGIRKRCELSQGGSTQSMMAAVKTCLAKPGERTQKVLVCIIFLGSQELVPVSTFHQAAYSSWSQIWLRAHCVKDGDGKAGRKTSTAKDLKYVLKPFAYIPLLKPLVPCVIMVVPGTWITSRRHPNASSEALSCWTKRCSERVFDEPFLKNDVGDFIVCEVEEHPTSEFVENHLLSFQGLHYGSELSPVGSEAMNSSIPSPHRGFHLWEGSIS